MQNVTLALGGAWKVLLASLVLGAGLPILFALGVRSLAWGSGGDAEVLETGVTVPRRRPVGLALGWLLFLIVLLGVILGITFIVASGFGMKLDFTHVFPTIVKK